jgi:FkbM family methyltransferase
MGRLWAQLFSPAVSKGASADSRVLDFFNDHKGVFVEVGANHPIDGSQTYALERRGWSGILVEPLSEYASRLRRERSAKVFEVAAGAPADSGKQLPLLVADALSTLRPNIKAGTRPTEQRFVPIRTLDSMLIDAGIEHIDFLSIDVEGAELDVLNGLSLAKYRPRLILLEDDAHSRDKHLYMTGHGYKLVRRTNLNNWYVPAAIEFPISVFGRWQLFRKLYLGAPLRRWKFKLRELRRKIGF